MRDTKHLGKYANKLVEKAKEKILFRSQRKAVEAGAHGALDYTIKEGVNKKKIDLSENFENLHTLSYKKILENKGYEINSIRPGIELVYKIKNSKSRTKKEDYHPLLNKIIMK